MRSDGRGLLARLCPCFSVGRLLRASHSSCAQGRSEFNYLDGGSSVSNLVHENRLWRYGYGWNAKA